MFMKPADFSPKIGLEYKIQVGFYEKYQTQAKRKQGKGKKKDDL